MKYNKKVLPSGLRVITVPMKDNPTVTVLVLVEAGSKYEHKKNNGISHFLEHMCFKGTEKRPRSIDISGALDSVGAEYNAFTGQEYTGYYGKADSRHLELVLDVVSDIYLHSTFPKPEMEKEKGVIIEEINMYQDLPQRHVEDLFMELLYGKQPAGWNIAGPKENIRKMKREDFLDYREEQYVAEATTVVIAGNFDEEKTAAEAAEKFSAMSKAKKKEKLPTKDGQKKPAVLFSYKKTDQTHLVLGVRSFDAYDKKNPAVGVVRNVLSGGMSGRLFQKLREEMGVCYYVKANNDAFTDHGIFSVAAGVDNKRFAEVVKVLLAEFARLKNELVSETELKKVKDFMTGSLRLHLESSDDLAEFYGGQEILRKEIKRPDDLVSEIEKVSAEDVQKIAREIFVEKNLNLAAVGPVSAVSKAKFLKMLKI